MFVPFVHTSKVCIYISVCCLKDEAGFGICVLSYTRSIYFCLVCSVMIYMKDNLFLKQPISLFLWNLNRLRFAKDVYALFEILLTLHEARFKNLY